MPFPLRRPERPYSMAGKSCQSLSIFSLLQYFLLSFQILRVGRVDRLILKKLSNSIPQHKIGKHLRALSYFLSSSSVVGNQSDNLQGKLDSKIWSTAFLKRPSSVHWTICGIHLRPTLSASSNNSLCEALSGSFNCKFRNSIGIFLHSKFLLKSISLSLSVNLTPPILDKDFIIFSTKVLCFS